MTDATDDPDDPSATAEWHLQELGLSTYAARTFVALVALGSGTARDVSEVADVPRSRVYDAVDELGDVGLVDVGRATPQQFWPVSPQTAVRNFERRNRSRVEALATALEDLDATRVPPEEVGVWTVEGRSNVTERCVEFVDAAEERVVFMSVDALLTDELVDALERASARDVEMRLGGLEDRVYDRITEEVPAAETFDSLWVWSDNPAGRLLLVDGSRTLVSVLAEDGDDPRDETAIWGAGERNSLVVVLRAMFSWRLGDLDADEG